MTENKQKNTDDADRKYFTKKLSEGYIEMAPGSGDWVPNDSGYGESRIAYLLAFYHPDGKVFAFERGKERLSQGSSRHTGPFEKEYTEEEFRKHLDNFQIEMSNRKNLEKAISELDNKL